MSSGNVVRRVNPQRSDDPGARTSRGVLRVGTVVLGEARRSLNSDTSASVPRNGLALPAERRGHLALEVRVMLAIVVFELLVLHAESAGGLPE